ncbi:MAG: helix-turn-helix transcriptional regulator [Flavobacteriales bacterium]|nr:helix-turn-helix transcriptional regulator [Flavobacteriales bacterium]
MENTTLNDRIVQLMKHLDLTPATFADEIGVQRSGITHITNGRNRPSLDMISKIIDCFPDVSLEWLLKGKGQISSSAPRILNMQKNVIPSEPVIDNSLKNTLFDGDDAVKHVETKAQNNEAKYTHSDFIESEKKDIEPTTIPTEPSVAETPKFINTIKDDKKITKILVFFSDNTFEELIQNK